MYAAAACEIELGFDFRLILFLKQVVLGHQTLIVARALKTTLQLQRSIKLLGLILVRRLMEN